VKDEPVRARLVERRVGPHVVEGGLDYLVGEWTRIAAAVERRETWLWEEWVNDLDTRDILDDVLVNVPEAAGARPSVEAVDERFRAAAVATEACAWGDEVAQREGWTREREWWYWTAPPTPFER
jgi:hypothetical protein